MRLLVIQHVACEPPGYYEDELRRRGVTFDRVDLGAGDRLPSWTDYDGLLVMGGPMGVGDVAQHPWLAPELETIAAAVRAGVSYLGICLGAQLLAAALDGRVHQGPAPEVGVGEVRPADAARTDPVLGVLPSPTPVLHWHQDTFTLPPGAQLLAGSAQYPHQAFRWDEAWGLQFHLEVSPELSRTWFDLDAYRDSADAALGASARDLPDALAAIADRTQVLAGAVMGRWVQRCEERLHDRAADQLGRRPGLASM